MSLFYMIETSFVFPCLPMKECRAMTSKLFQTYIRDKWLMLKSSIFLKLEIDKCKFSVDIQNLSTLASSAKC